MSLCTYPCLCDMLWWRFTLSNRMQVSCPPTVQLCSEPSHEATFSLVAVNLFSYFMPAIIKWNRCTMLPTFWHIPDPLIDWNDSQIVELLRCYDTSKPLHSLIPFLDRNTHSRLCLSGVLPASAAERPKCGKCGGLRNKVWETNPVSTTGMNVFGFVSGCSQLPENWRNLKFCQISEFCRSTKNR